MLYAIDQHDFFIGPLFTRAKIFKYKIVKFSWKVSSFHGIAISLFYLTYYYFQGKKVYNYIYVCMCVCVCKVFCPEAGPSLDMHYQGSTYLSFLDKRKEWDSMSSPFLTEPVDLWEYLSLHTQTQECCKYNY